MRLKATQRIADRERAVFAAALLVQALAIAPLLHAWLQHGHKGSTNASSGSAVPEQHDEQLPHRHPQESPAPAHEHAPFSSLHIGDTLLETPEAVRLAPSGAPLGPPVLGEAIARQGRLPRPRARPGAP